MSSFSLLRQFGNREVRCLGTLFAVAYFSQGIYGLPAQAISTTLMHQGFSAGSVANFFLLVSIPWLVKPLYGILSDSISLFGQHRKSYLLLTSMIGGIPFIVAGFSIPQIYWELVVLYGVMGLGVAFSDVLIDALMIENGKRFDLTGEYQSIQWAAYICAVILVGLIGGYFAEYADLQASFAVAGLFPFLVFFMAMQVVQEPRRVSKRGGILNAKMTIQRCIRTKLVWLLVGFVFLFAFKPSLNTSLWFFQTKILRFDQQFIGVLNSIGAAASLIGTVIYAPLVRFLGVRTLLNLIVGLSLLAAISFFFYQDEKSALAIHCLWGSVWMLSMLAILDLTARISPAHVEATFFALLMAVSNFGSQLGNYVGGHLFSLFETGGLGYHFAIAISALATASMWLLIPNLSAQKGISFGSESRSER